jgi:predicted nucleic acid-binding protein
MPDKAFLDTNVLVYAFSSNDPRKAVADELLVQGCSIGVQTLNEFINVQRGKLKRPWGEVTYWLKIIQRLCPPAVPMTLPLHYMGLEIAQRYGYRIHDSTMLAAALEASCTVFYSEDMQDGQTIGDLTICNPFTRRG